MPLHNALADGQADAGSRAASSMNCTASVVLPVPGSPTKR
jgi:hypothetical protein